MAIIINTHAEIEFNIFGLTFNHPDIFSAANPYIIKVVKSNIT